MIKKVIPFSKKGLPFSVTTVYYKVFRQKNSLPRIQTTVCVLIFNFSTLSLLDKPN
jgi:hypothetical protein